MSDEPEQIAAVQAVVDSTLPSTGAAAQVPKAPSPSAPALSLKPTAVQTPDLDSDEEDSDDDDDADQGPGLAFLLQEVSSTARRPQGRRVQLANPFAELLLHYRATRTTRMRMRTRISRRERTKSTSKSLTRRRMRRMSRHPSPSL